MRGSPKQEAARKRASWIRTLRGIRLNLIEDEGDRQTMLDIIDRQLKSMGAETISDRAYRHGALHERLIRHNLTDQEWDEFGKTAKPYKMTNADIKRYDRW